MYTCVYSGRDGEDMVQGWSEATLTEEVTQSGRYSTWSTEEWVSEHLLQ